MGRVLVACFAAKVGGVPPVVTITSTLRAISSAASAGEPLELPRGISVFNHDVAALDVTEVTQSLAEGVAQVEIRGRVERQKADSRDLGRLLRLDAERRGEHGPRPVTKARRSIIR
jgi:hypothetical protein